MRWLFLTLALLVNFQQFAETRKYVAESYIYSTPKRVSKWSKCNIPIEWDKDNNTVRIYSEADQKITYKEIIEHPSDTVNILVINAIDEDSLKLILHYIEFKEGYKYFQINYQNIQYVYAVKEIY